ncbi:hypothetical protein HYD_6860 [Candidatus Hydrogenosomobacter endosymbioticus]|uniref:DNA-directed RNA polymerase subunit omega n=1 Tax=Candidatus Hydrogenosomobacter endosymbioticus TaxID=2558174 RepID=A0ABN6L3L5_9PROT|nr:hypothetical protein HYD_6860 [Candidatus Hydrogenosomobacter endosymbioticus]
MDGGVDHFRLAMAIAYRAKQLSSGVEANVPKNNDKNVVIALREIACGAVSIGYMEETMISGFQRYSYLIEGGE